MSYFIRPSALSHFIPHVSLRYQHSAIDIGDESHEIILSFIAELTETTGRISSKLLHKQDEKNPSPRQRGVVSNTLFTIFLIMA